MTAAPMATMLFDLSADPEQLHNVHAAAAHQATRDELRARLHEQLRCSGRTCK